MKPERFAIAINCFDGRAQQPVIDWLRLNCSVDYVDLITEPGVDKCLAEETSDVVRSIRSKVELGLRVHAASVIAVAGHHDCIANPVSRGEHLELIGEGVKVVTAWGLPVRVLGLYVNEWRSIDVVVDTKERGV